MSISVVKKAIEQIEDPNELQKSKECYTEARARLAVAMSEKRRKNKREGKEDTIEEDDPAVYKRTLWVTVTKVC